MKNYSSSLTNTSQSQPVPGKGMVKNNAGGYGFQITPAQQLLRFLLIGSEGGTYHVGEQKLTIENAENIVKLIQTSGRTVVDTVINVLTNNRAPKQDASLFVLALCATYGDEETKKASYDAIHKVCKTATHLFTFLSNVQNLRGWSRGLRKGVAKFYTTKDAEKLAYQMVKYRDRAGFTHKDALRLSHAQSNETAINSLFGYAVGKVTAEESGSSLVAAFEKAQKTEDDKELLKLIKNNKLTWEMVPNTKLNSEDVLKALLPNMPLVALIRNLNRFSYNGLTETNNETVQQIVDKLTNEELVKKSGIHPVNVINSMLTYQSGRGTKGDKTWAVNQNIVDALNETYELAVKTAESTGMDILVGADCSGSMQVPVGGMAMNCSQIANVLAVTLLKTEKKSELVWFDTAIQTPTIGKRTSISDVLANAPHGGGTDCAQPILHALKNNKKYDVIYILTDNETWAGRTHGIQALEQYRRTVNKDVKVVEIAMTATGVSTMPSNDPNILRVVGFDASVMEVVNRFLTL